MYTTDKTCVSNNNNKTTTREVAVQEKNVSSIDFIAFNCKKNKKKTRKNHTAGNTYLEQIYRNFIFHKILLNVGHGFFGIFLYKIMCAAGGEEGGGYV